MIQVAIMGYGTVGSGVAEVIHTNREGIKRELKEDMEVKYILDLRDFPGDPEEKKIVHDFDIIVNDPEIDIVVETMGGVHPAYEFSKRALEAGKSVCTSNKELVASCGAELLETAKEHNVNYFYEASVGGGIPIIRPLNYALTAEIIEEITGILNGTTNYILTRMKNEGLDFAEVLKAAQDLGYAEKNPEVDVDRLSAIREVVTIPLVLHGTSGVPDDIVRECVRRGICKVNYATDLRIAFSKGVKAYMQEDPDVFDPKKYNARGREEVKQYVMSKIFVCGSDGRA